VELNTVTGVAIRDLVPVANSATPFDLCLCTRRAPQF